MVKKPVQTNSAASERYVHLQSAKTSIVLMMQPAPAIVYWGKKIDAEAPLSGALFDLPVGQARLDVAIPLALIPEQGRGDFGSPGIEGHRNGKDWAPVFEVISVTATLSCATITMSDPRAGLEVCSRLSLDEDTDVLTLSHKLTNTGTTEYALQRLALTLPVNDDFIDLISLHGRWSHEFHQQRLSFKHGGYVQENRRGRTSHEYFPGLIALQKDTNELRGDLIGMHLGWSGNHRVQAQVKSDGRRYLQAEALLAPGEVSIAPGESFSTPELFAVFSAEGLNGIMQRFHQFVRHQILDFPQPKLRPVHFNTWEGIYFDHEPHRIMEMATAVARLGVERFIVDDGWFTDRDDDTCALGDWQVDKRKYPEGFKPVIDHINQLGMEFGLWVEPEMVCKNSALYRAHPEWMLGMDELGYQQPAGRSQFLLDLQNPEAFDYLLSSLDSLMTEYNIGYLKWDMNRELVQSAHQGHAAYHGQTLALYRLIDALREKHPYVEIESCASGGGRVDFEVLKRTHRFWTSDCNDALERQTIQRGMQLFFPPEVMGSHIGPRLSHTTRRCHDMSLRGITALFGHMGAELDPQGLEDSELRAFSKYIALHKQYRPLLHSGTSFILPSVDPGTHIYGVMDESVVLLAVVQLTMPEHALGQRLKMPILSGDKSYRVEVVDVPAAFNKTMKHLPVWIEKTQVVNGDQLSQIGLSLPVMDPESAMLLSFTVES
ncbi:Alpha-galactosidase [Grimontia celer]|uniref:Alpha-galactosidase n=1 Tax=Grimontia celer TaxID=1796497 RepID=A0A128F3X0_9GAMM|nr:alpha-galactosidase [Grimontia celer]CZF80966.1 Alpha-galactosidase [Grimontia celer]